MSSIPPPMADSSRDFPAVATWDTVVDLVTRSHVGYQLVSSGHDSSWWSELAVTLWRTAERRATIFVDVRACRASRVDDLLAAAQRTRVGGSSLAVVVDEGVLEREAAWLSEARAHAQLVLDGLGARGGSLRALIDHTPRFAVVDATLIREAVSSRPARRAVALLTDLCSDVGCTPLATCIDSREAAEAALELGISMVAGPLFGRGHESWPEVDWSRVATQG